MSTAEPPQDWSLAQRVAFRFALAYFVVYCFPFPLEQIPGVSLLAEAYQQLWFAAVPWVGKQFLNLDISIFPGGSGDTTFNYVQVLCYVVLALAATLVWSWLDRRRPSYPQLHGALRVYLRYYLALTMLSYGMAKVMRTQFPFPGPDRMLQTLGQSSPMGLLWNFMGFSTAYSVFAGLSEVVGGLLLLLRRTTLLGVLILVAVMSNVVMMNFCFDVPVKLFSLHLLAMALFLLLPDAGRLASFFVAQRPTVPPVLWMPFASRWMNRGKFALKFAFVGGILASTALEAVQTWKQFGEDAPQHALYGIYEVDEFTQDDAATPSSDVDAVRWRRVIVNRNGRMAIQYENGSMPRFWLTDAPEKSKLSLSLSWKGVSAGELAYSRPDADRLLLDGTLDGASIHARLRRVPQSQFPLAERGFHWINEYPYNR